MLDDHMMKTNYPVSIIVRYTDHGRGFSYSTYSHPDITFVVSILNTVIPTGAA